MQALFRLTYKRAIRDSHLPHFGFVLPDDLQPLIHLHLFPHAPDTLHPLRLRTDAAPIASGALLSP
jgi:hypothetical protein